MTSTHRTAIVWRLLSTKGWHRGQASSLFSPEAWRSATRRVYVCASRRNMIPVVHFLSRDTSLYTIHRRQMCIYDVLYRYLQRPKTIRAFYTCSRPPPTRRANGSSRKLGASQICSMSPENYQPPVEEDIYHIDMYTYICVRARVCMYVYMYIECRYVYQGADSSFTFLERQRQPTLNIPSSYVHFRFHANSYLCRLGTNGRYVAAPTVTGHVYIWNVAAGQKVAVLRDAGAGVWSPCFMVG